MNSLPLKPKPGFLVLLLRFFLSAFSAWIFNLSFPGGPWPALAWFHLVPLGIALHNSGIKEGALCGFLFGFLGWLSSVWWVSVGLNLWVELSMPQAWLSTIVFSMYSALPYVLFGILNGLFSSLKKPLGPIKNACLLTILVSWFPNVFPGNASHSLYSYPIFIQVLDIGGVPLLLFILNLVNLLVVDIIIKLTKKKRPLKSSLVLMIVFAMLIGYGQYRLDGLRAEIKTADSARIANIVSIQPNIPLAHDKSADSIENDNAVLTALSLSNRALADYPRTELVTWPELPVWFGCQEESKDREKLEATIKKAGIPFLICCSEWGENETYYNTAVMIKKSGKNGQSYHKKLLVPFGEYLPYEKELPFLRKLFPGTLEYVPGKINVLYDLKQGVKIIPSLCYEIIFSKHIRDFVKMGGNIILNMTDDAWFGNSDASAIHMALGIYRAVEFRVPLIRVTNSGNGLFVQATGEIIPGSRTPVFAKKITSFPVYIPEKTSFYLKAGDLFLYCLTLFFIFELLLSTVIGLFNGRQTIPGSPF